MTLESDAKFEEKLALGFKNDMMNLVNLNVSNDKFENFQFDVLFLSIAYKASARKAQKTLKNDPNFEEKLTFYLKNDMRNLMNFKLRVDNLKICTLMRYFCQKYVMF